MRLLWLPNSSLGIFLVASISIAFTTVTLLSALHAGAPLTTAIIAFLAALPLTLSVVV